MRVSVFRLVVPVVLLAATAIAMGREPARKDKPPSNPGGSSAAKGHPAPATYRIPDDDAGGGPPPPVVMTKVVDYSIPAWGATESDTFRLTWTTDGLQSVETLDGAGNVIDRVTRQDYDAIVQNMPTIPFTGPGVPTFSIVSPPALATNLNCRVVVNGAVQSVSGIPGPADSAFTFVVRVHD